MRGVRMFLTGLISLICVFPGAAQDAPSREQSDLDRYVRIVAVHFGIPSGEISILADGGTSPDELPVALTLAQLSGLSPVTLLARRRAGESWASIARRVNLGAASFHIEIPDSEVDATIARIHELYRTTPQSSWNAIEVRDDELVTLANLAALRSHLGVSFGQILAARAATGSFVAATGSLAATR